MATDSPSAPKSSSQDKKKGPNLQKTQSAELHSAQRALPHAIGPEKSILSSMFQDPQQFIGLAIENKLTVDHFYQPAHGILFQILIELFEDNEPIELVSLSQTLMNRSLMASVGGPAAVTEIYTYSPTHAHFEHHLDIVKDKYVLRSVIRHCTDAITRAYDDQEEVEQLLDNVESQVLAIREGAEKNKEETIADHMKTVIANFEAFIHRDEDSRGLLTGYSEIDKMSNGLKPGEMFIIAARPSMGKTSFAMNLVEHFCLDLNLPALVFSLEMGAFQLVERLLYARARFDKSKVMKGFEPVKSDFVNIKRASEEIRDCKLFIDDTPSITINELRAKARRKKKEEDIKVIAIDYLQLMRSNSKQAQNSREREVAEISAGLKGLGQGTRYPHHRSGPAQPGPGVQGGQQVAVAANRACLTCGSPAPSSRTRTWLACSTAPLITLTARRTATRKTARLSSSLPKTVTAQRETCRCTSSRKSCALKPVHGRLARAS